MALARSAILRRSITPRMCAPLMRASPRAQSTVTTDGPSDVPTAAKEVEAAPANRFVVTCEVLVSKIFPAGFGWQAASVVAGNQGFEADTLNFALTTGAGDFAGVLAGHSTYSIVKNMMGSGGDLKNDLVAGLWLATAAFCSGTAWQPTVNFLHDAAGCSFAQTVVGCGIVTGFSFFAGLRIGRVIYSPLGLPGMDYANLTGDALLSVSIGAATGTFVGTDITFTDNVIRPFFGIDENMTDLEGCIRAGASTTTGFFAMQTLQNVTLPKNANWIDPVKI